jgi:hypothetical protein
MAKCQPNPWSTDLLEKITVTHSQEIPCLLWNMKVCYRVYKSLPLIPILNQMYPVHIFPLYFPTINSNVILPYTTRSSERSLPFRFSNQFMTGAGFEPVIEMFQVVHGRTHHKPHGCCNWLETLYK